MTPVAPLCLAPLPPTRRGRVMLPAGACDAHFHVFADEAIQPYAAARDYTPQPSPYDAYRAMAETHGLDRAILVQPSVYGTDNRLLLDTLAGDPQRLRGIVVLSEDPSEAMLDMLHDGGVRGVRLNLCNPGPNRLGDAALLGSRLSERGWHIQLQLDLAAFDIDLASVARQAQTALVVDHFGLLSATSLPARLQAFKHALDSGRIWVKLSAPYRCGAGAPPYPALDDLVRDLLDQWPDRLLWGSDWPHPGLTSGMPDDADLIDLIDHWAVNEAHLRKIFVTNPDALYWR